MPPGLLQTSKMEQFKTSEFPDNDRFGSAEAPLNVYSPERIYHKLTHKLFLVKCFIWIKILGKKVEKGKTQIFLLCLLSLISTYVHQFVRVTFLAENVIPAQSHPTVLVQLCGN